MIGYGNILLKKVLREKRDEQEVELNYKGKAAGWLFVDLEFIEDYQEKEIGSTEEEEVDL